jgi:hypothetical protein
VAPGGSKGCHRSPSPRAAKRTPLPSPPRPPTPGLLAAIVVPQRTLLPPRDPPILLDLPPAKSQVLLGAAPGISLGFQPYPVVSPSLTSGNRLLRQSPDQGGSSFTPPGSGASSRHKLPACGRHKPTAIQAFHRQVRGGTSINYSLFFFILFIYILLSVCVIRPSGKSQT